MPVSQSTTKVDRYRFSIVQNENIAFFSGRLNMYSMKSKIASIYIFLILTVIISIAWSTPIKKRSPANQGSVNAYITTVNCDGDVSTFVNQIKDTEGNGLDTCHAFLTSQGLRILCRDKKNYTMAEQVYPLPKARESKCAILNADVTSITL